MIEAEEQYYNNNYSAWPGEAKDTFRNVLSDARKAELLAEAQALLDDRPKKRGLDAKTLVFVATARAFREHTNTGHLRIGSHEHQQARRMAEKLATPAGAQQLISQNLVSAFVDYDSRSPLDREDREIVRRSFAKAAASLGAQRG